MCTALHSVYNTFPERDKTSAGGGLSLGVTSVSGIWDRPRGSHSPRPRARLANEEIKVKWLNKRTPNGEGRVGTGTQSPPGSEKRPSLHLEALNVTPVVAGWSPGLQSLTPRPGSNPAFAAPSEFRQLGSLHPPSGAGWPRTSLRHAAVPRMRHEDVHRSSATELCVCGDCCLEDGMVRVGVYDAMSMKSQAPDRLISF